MSSNTENIVYLIMGIGLAALISFVIVLFQRKKVKEVWEGTVTRIDRFSETDSNDMETDFIRVSYFRTDGKHDSLKVQAAVFGMFFPLDLKPGDRLVKLSGEAIPKRVA